MMFIIGSCCMFLYNDDDAVLTWIFYIMNITCPKVSDGILTSL